MEEQEAEQEKNIITEEDCDETRAHIITLEDKLDLEQEKLLLASCNLLKIYPALDVDFDGIDRSMGRMDIKWFYEACLGCKVNEEESVEESMARAHQLRNVWIGKMITSYEMAEDEGRDVAFKPYDANDLEALKETFGEDLYRTIRKAFRELRVAVKTGVEYKPWNVAENREATLSELLDALPEIARPSPSRRR